VPNIVTAEEVYDLSGVSVNAELIARAQLGISTAAGVRLDDADTFAGMRLRDQRTLTTAVVWQAIYLDKHPEAFAGGERPANVVSASANGASITYDNAVSADVAPLALRELETLSWRQQKDVTVRTLRAYSSGAYADRTWSDTTTADPPLLAVYRGPQPDPWA
jgi:hypothetical protein